MTDIETKVIAAWKDASSDLGFKFTSPYVVTLPNGSRCEYPGLVHQYGSRHGTLIAVLHEPSNNLPRPERNDYFWSSLGPGYAAYERQKFIDTLDDWQFFGPENERPFWYSGKSWT